MPCSICGAKTPSGRVVCDSCKKKFAPPPLTPVGTTARATQSIAPPSYVEDEDQPAIEVECYEETYPSPYNTAQGSEISAEPPVADELDEVKFINTTHVPAPHPSEDTSRYTTPLEDFIPARYMVWVILAGALAVVLAILFSAQPWKTHYHAPRHAEPVLLDQVEEEYLPPDSAGEQ